MDIDEIVWFFSPSITLIIFPSSHILPSGCHIYEKAEKMLTFSGEIQVFLCSSANPSRSTILCKFFALIKHSLIVISSSLASPPLLPSSCRGMAACTKLPPNRELRLQCYQGQPVYSHSSFYGLRKLQILFRCLALRRFELESIFQIHFNRLIL